VTATRDAPRRRTQEERSAATIKNLLHAAAATLIDVGYAEASVQVICARAGVSQGALFRHFPTREALMVAVGHDVAERTLRHYRAQFQRLRGRLDKGRDASPLEAYLLALRLVRAHARSRLNLAWYELAMAARTRPALRKSLAPVLARYHTDIAALAAELLPGLAAQLGDRFAGLVDLVVAMFDGESVERFVVSRPKADDARMELLAMLAGLVTSTER
jgi:AcrR family transcriptional regulator